MFFLKSSLVGTVLTLRWEDRPHFAVQSPRIEEAVLGETYAFL